MQRWQHVCVVAASLCSAAWLYTTLRESKVEVTEPPLGTFIRSVRDDHQRTQPVSAEPSVRCLVVTSPQHHCDRARHVQATWGQRGRGGCPTTLFVTSAPDPALHNVIISNFSRYEELWGKVVEGFMQLDTSSADWFVKADDDTFLIYPNLLTLLSSLDPFRPLYLGLPLLHRQEVGEEVTYMSGGAGYVLSRGALARLQGAVAAGVTECRYPGHTHYEDVNMGLCMAALGVSAGDTRDALGRPRFLPYPPWRLLQPHPDFDWLKRLSKYEFHFGAESMSDLVVSFHEIRDPKDFYLLQYLMYDLRRLPPGTSSPFTLSNRFPSS